MNKDNRLFLLTVFSSMFLLFPFLIKAVDPGCSAQTPTCLGTTKIDIYVCKPIVIVGGYRSCPGFNYFGQYTVYCTVDSNGDGTADTCSFNGLCTSNDTEKYCSPAYNTALGWYCAGYNCNTAGNCCGGSGTFCGDGSCNGSETCSSCPGDCGSCTCPDSCSGYQLIDHDSNCTNDSGCGTSATRYTGGACTVCSFNNSSCTNNFKNVVDSDCYVVGGMYTPENATVTIKKKVTLTSGSSLIIKTGGKISLEGGSIEIDGGYILMQQ